LDEGLSEVTWQNGFLVEFYDHGFAGEPEGSEEFG
jgi:hypothetical protein